MAADADASLTHISLACRVDRAASKTARSSPYGIGFDNVDLDAARAGRDRCDECPGLFSRRVAVTPSLDPGNGAKPFEAERSYETGWAIKSLQTIRRLSELKVASSDTEIARKLAAPIRELGAEIIGSMTPI